MARNPVDIPTPQTMASDDIDELETTINVEPFDYDEELYDEEINQFEDEEIAAVDALPYPIDDGTPEDPTVVTGMQVPVIYEDSIIREAHYVNGQYQYTVNFTVTNVPGAVDYEVRVTTV